MDGVFKALADPTRRVLLDELFREDGQTLGALVARKAMTRFGVMKHLQILEAAGLVVTRRRGREKLHYLNVVPIRLVHDRWVSKYAEPWAGGLSDLKTALESSMETHIYEIFIKTSPERLWQALVDPELRRKFTFGVGTFSDWQPGSDYVARAVDQGLDIARGENLVVEPPHRLVQTFQALWSEEVKAYGSTRVTFEIEPIQDTCKLVVTHDEIPAGANPEIYGGWPMILSGLKTLLETGELLTTPGSLRWATV